MTGELSALEAQRSQIVAELLRTPGVMTSIATEGRTLEHRCAVAAERYERAYSHFARLSSLSELTGRLWVLTAVLIAGCSIAGKLRSDNAYALSTAISTLLLSASVVLSSQRAIIAGVRLFATPNTPEYYDTYPTTSHAERSTTNADPPTP